MFPPVLNAQGLQLPTYADLVAYYTQAYESIYGPNIDLDPSTQDGQMMNTQIQALLDSYDLTSQIYNAFDPDNAIGVVLDQRVTINGIQRQGGTYTVTPVSIVTAQSVNLYGLDQTAQPVYTVADASGNNWLLIATELGVSPGTHSFNFRAASPGNVLPIPNTITVPVTIVLGVTSVNNPTSYISLGVNEESDRALRIRRLQSVSLASQGYLAGLLAALENVPNVSSAYVYENLTDTTDANGVPGHSIWVIVAGSGAPSAIAQAIYTKRNAGCGMKGNQTYTITQVDGSPFVVRWDDISTVNLFINLQLVPINSSIPPNIAAIRAGLVTNLIPGVNAEVNINEISTILQQIDPNTVVTSSSVSVGTTQNITFIGIGLSTGTFYLKYGSIVSTVLNWNDTISTVQSVLQAMAGLNTVTVTGGVGSSLNFDFSSLSDITDMIYIYNSTLSNGVNLITFLYTNNSSPFLNPPAKNNQFVISSPNIIIYNMQITPATITVAINQSQTFLGLGGYGPYTYTYAGASGGNVNATTGLYTAGSSTGTDTVTATDAFGKTAIATITVVS